MIILAICIGCLLGAIIGVNLPLIPYTYSSYLAISIVAALDSVFGGITATLNGKFNFKTFVSGFFGNAILSILLTYLGEKLNVDIYIGAIVVFVGRMFNNLGIIRRYYIDKWSKDNRTESVEDRKWSIEIIFLICYKNITKLLQIVLTFLKKYNILKSEKNISY